MVRRLLSVGDAIVPSMRLPVMPPLEPMLAKAVAELPRDGDWLFEPKWDGFRALVFRDGDELYPPEPRPQAARSLLPGAGWSRCGRPAAALRGRRRDRHRRRRRARLRGAAAAHPSGGFARDPAGRATPASFVAWDLLALDDADLMPVPQAERRTSLETVLDGVAPPVHLTPMTRDRDVAADWFARFEGAGLDGVVAKDAAARLPARQAAHAQDQARADRRLRRGGLPLAHERPGHACRLAGAWTVR